MTTKTKTTKNDAKTAHTSAIKDVERLIVRLQDRLADEKKIGAPNWANVGDMGRYRELLGQLLGDEG